MTALPVNPTQLAELWQQVRATAEERSKDFGDVALQYHLAEQLGLVELQQFPPEKIDVCFQVVTRGSAVGFRKLWAGLSWLGAFS